MNPVKVFFKYILPSLLAFYLLYDGGDSVRSICIIGAYESGRKLKEVEVDVDGQFPHMDPYDLDEPERERIIERGEENISLPKSVDEVSLEIERVEEWIELG